jgi:ABC-type lipoprotein release transport system permease subunit
VYFSIKLKNGEISEFEEQMEASERFAGRFLTVDQGFGAVMETLAQVGASTMKLMGMCLAGWAMLMMLYLLLYQGGQRKNIGIMRSLGASPQVAGDYLWKSGLTVAAIGIAVGTAASLVVVQFTQSKLLQNAVAQLPGKYSIGGLTDEAVQLMAQESQLPVWLLLLLALAQMALFGLVLLLHARQMARRSPRSLLSK